MVASGYRPEVAYLECINELRLVVEIIYHKGLKGLRRGASNTEDDEHLLEDVGKRIRSMMRWIPQEE